MPMFAEPGIPFSFYYPTGCEISRDPGDNDLSTGTIGIKDETFAFDLTLVWIRDRPLQSSAGALPPGWVRNAAAELPTRHGSERALIFELSQWPLIARFMLQSIPVPIVAGGIAGVGLWLLGQSVLTSLTVGFIATGTAVCCLLGYLLRSHIALDDPIIVFEFCFDSVLYLLMGRRTTVDLCAATLAFDPQRAERIAKAWNKDNFGNEDLAATKFISKILRAAVMQRLFIARHQ